MGKKPFRAMYAAVVRLHFKRLLSRITNGKLVTVICAPTGMRGGENKK